MDITVVGTGAANAEWVEVGEGSATGGGISDDAGNSVSPSLAIDSDGTPIVAWYDSSAGIYVERLNGTAWAEFSPGSASEGGISGNATPFLGSWYPSLAINANNNPAVAWYDSGATVYFKQFNGTAWA